MNVLALMLSVSSKTCSWMLRVFLGHLFSKVGCLTCLISNAIYLMDSWALQGQGLLCWVCIMYGFARREVGPRLEGPTDHKLQTRTLL